ncbi:MAG TPA: PspC domain-containing protein, partial [Bacteroidia bacterium]|nr:PspC domain-containing protein [Bacteroidia bacterium]
MNKTVTINISGIVFHIEEDAYARLQDYLAKVRNKFSSEEGREEIMADIESRIAEIFSEKTGPFKQVVMMADVENVISQMGEPEVIGEESSSAKTETASDNTDHSGERRYRRRLYRDPDDKVIGGVCSGLGYYFDIDHVWIRLGFAVLFFVFGTGLLFYILLMIIIPKAETTTERLEMRGEPVDINNIGKTIKEEFEEFGTRAKRKGEEWKKSWKEEKYKWKRRRDGRSGADDFFHGVFRAMSRLIAFVLIFVGILFLIGLLTS